MTFVTETRISDETVSLAISSAVYGLVQRIADYRTYRETLSGLRGLNKTQLAELGLQEGDIRRVATAAVYGSRG